MRITVQRLRNLTTRRLHTHIGDVCEDLETILATPIAIEEIAIGIRAITPWLKKQDLPSTYWDDSKDQRNQSIYYLEDMSAEEQASICTSWPLI